MTMAFLSSAFQARRPKMTLANLRNLGIEQRNRLQEGRTLASTALRRLAELRERAREDHLPEDEIRAALGEAEG
jgi:hypothetical protein